MGDLNGIPVVFLHAYPLNGGMWASARARVADRQTVAPSFPGFGGLAPGPEDLDGFADAALEDAARAGVQRAVFVGLSMGGYVAFRIWERARERVAGFVFADTRAGADTEEAAERRWMQAERARREGIAWLPDEMLPGVLGETTRQSRPEVVEGVRRMILEAEPEGVARALLAMRARPDSLPLLPTIDVPVLVVVGEEDGITGVDEARAIAEGIPSATLRTIPGAGHLSNLENPAAFESALADFLTR